MPKIQLDIDFRFLCVWLLPACKPSAAVGLQLASGAKYEQEAAESFASDLEVFGLSAAAVPDCDVLLAIENDSGGEKAYSRMLEEFSKSRAQKMYLFCVNWLTKSTFAKSILDANRLDRSILLPKYPGFPSPQIQCSLLILDKARRDANDRTARRDANDRTEILFLDASNMNMDGLEDAAKRGDKETARQIIEETTSSLPQVEKDFRDVIRWDEPLLASYHCARSTLDNALHGSNKTIADCVDIIKCPSFLKTEGGKYVELSCLSPRDFAPYGFTSIPSSAERKKFQVCRVKPEQHLRAYDILLVSQSNVGKLCIVDDSFNKGGWTGSSFTWIIRPKADLSPRLDPRALYIYLASMAVNGYLTACSKGSALPMLPVQSLRSLPVPLFSEKEQSDMIACFERLARIHRSITKLTARARMHLNAFYSTS